MKTTARTTAYAATAAWARIGLALGVLMLAAAAAVLRPAAAQDEAPGFTLASPEELDELVGPIALYPDDLVAIVLPASTYPLQVVAAERFLEDRERDSGLDPDEEWDDSVVALLNYPEVIELLNDDLDWMYDLGAAVLNQRADVLDAIQRFRDRAYDAGNLRSDDRQTVTRADRTIAIRPSDPEVIYVPYYEPEYVVIYQPYPVYHYYPRRYPVYYYPYPASYVFDTGFFWGVRSWFSIGWHTHYLHVYDYGYYSHPYYGWRYYDPWYVRNVYINVNVGNGYVWEPRHRYGGRPVVRGYEGRVYTADQPPRASSVTSSGSTYRSRSTEGQARTVPRATTTERTSGSGATSTYRNGGTAANRSTVTTERAQQGAAANRPTATTGGGMSRARQPSNTSRGTVVTREGSYRSGGGMSQAREVRTVPQANREAPRGLGSAPTMSREAPRSVAPQRAEAPRAQAPRAEAPVSRAPTRGSFEAPPRSSGGDNNGGGSYRGGDSGGGNARSASGGGNSRGGDSGGGSNRGGGGGGERSHPASRR
jgi:hypothetical protein